LLGHDSAFLGLGREEKSFGDQLFESSTDSDGFLAESDGGSIRLIGFWFFEFGGDFGEPGFESKNPFFQFSNFCIVLFFETTFSLASFGLGTFLLFGFAWGRTFFRRARGWGGFGCDWLGVGELFPSGQGGPGGGGLLFFEVVLIVASVGSEVTRADVKDGGRHSTDEVNIVTDKNERSFVLVERGN